MLIIVDARAPEEAKENLRGYGEVVEFATRNITYDAVSGHPDIFFCNVGKELVAATNTPEIFLDTLRKNNIEVRTGNLEIGSYYPDTARYNAVSSADLFIHNLDITDPDLLMMAWDRQQVHVTQGYCRCNLLALRENHFITSDKGIESILKDFGKVLFVSPEEILLPGFDHGFWGGTCGMSGDRIFIMGSLNRIKQGAEIRNFIAGLHYEIIELYDGPLFDGGGLFLL